MMASEVYINPFYTNFVKKNIVLISENSVKKYI